MRIFVAESEDKRVNPYEISMARVLQDMGVKKHSITRCESVKRLNSSFDLLILVTLTIAHMEGRVLVGSASIKSIREFVSSGGVCWITQQQINDTNLAWLPSHLDTLRFRYEYVPRIYSRRKDGEALRNEMRPYICPWILDRTHPLWNKPNHIDESHFLYWKPRVEGEEFHTAATHIIFAKGWDILAGYSGPEINLKHKAALVMEGRYNKGLYLWTELFSPQVFWRNKESFGKHAWKLLLENLLTYFRDFRHKKVLKAGLVVKPWSVKTGQKVKIKVETDKLPETIKKVTLQIEQPSGEKEQIDIFPSSAFSRCYTYIPKTGGIHRLKAKVETGESVYSYASASVRVIDGFTPVRFSIHTHFGNNFQTCSLGTLYGIARKLGIDVIVLASVTTWKGFRQKLMFEEIKKADSPEVRFFPGQEIHTQLHCGREDGLAFPERWFGRRHAISIGCGWIDYNPWKWEPSVVKKIHEKKGLAIVAHPEPYDWWTVLQNKDNFEGAEINYSILKLWDKQIKKGGFIGLQGTDNADAADIYFRQGYNTGWFDRPVCLTSLIDTILRGRVTKMVSYPEPFHSLENFLWFDINNQPVGGTIYAVDKVVLHIRAKSHLPLREMRVVKSGNRNYKVVRLNSRNIDCSMEETISEDTYYRIELYNDRGYCQSGFNFTNPIFVKKIKGPPESYFYFQNSAPYFFHKGQGKWVANLTRVKNISFRTPVWKVKFYEPGGGKLFVGWKEMNKIEVDGKTVNVDGDKRDDEQIFAFKKGSHQIKLFSASV